MENNRWVEEMLKAENAKKWLHRCKDGVFPQNNGESEEG
jgi:hypothetical protein